MNKIEETVLSSPRAWVAVMLLALALIGLYIGKALLKSPGDADSARAKGTAAPPNTELGTGSGGKTVSAEPEYEVTDGVLPSGRKVRLVTRPACRKNWEARPSVPPYPFGIPSAQEETWRMLRTSLITLEFTDVDFLEIAAWLTKETGLVMVTSKEQAEKTREEVAQAKKAAEERRAKIALILGTTMSIGFEEAPMWEVAPKLESACGLPVVTDKETWFSDMRVTLAPGVYTLKEVLEKVCSETGTKWIVEVDKIYLIKK